MAKYVGAVDQGTTSTRFMIFDHGGKVIGLDQKEHEQIYPKPGWVEHNPMEIWTRTQEVVDGALRKAGLTASDLAAVGVTNQRETTVVWEKATGKPVYNAIVWQDTRTDQICNALAKTGGQNRFRKKVGLPLATYFSGPKIKWVLDNVKGARARAAKGELLFGNIDTWVIWNLTGGPNGGVHVTDVSNASRTMLMNLETLDWDADVAKAMGVPMMSSKTVTTLASLSVSHRAARSALVIECVKPGAGRFLRAAGHPGLGNRPPGRSIQSRVSSGQFLWRSVAIDQPRHRARAGRRYCSKSACRLPGYIAAPVSSRPRNH